MSMGKAQADRPPLGVRERRRFGRRLAVTHPLEVAGRSGGFAAQTVNVSRTGVLLWVCDESFLPVSESENMVLFTERVAEEFGEGLEVRLSQDIALEGEVVRVTRRNEKDAGTVLIACRYARPLTQEEWIRLDFERIPPDDIEQEMAQELGAGHAEVSGADRRRARRLDHAQPVEIHSDYAAYRAQVVNVSAVGVLLEMTDPAFAAPNGADRLLVCTRRLGTQFGRGMRVRFLEADVTVEGEIVRVGERKNAAGAEILVGCKFDPPLDPATCQQLGIDPLRKTRPEQRASTPTKAGETRIRTLLKSAHDQGASDLHLKPGSAPRIRVGGLLSNLESDVLDAAETHAMALELMDGHRKDRFEETGHAELVLPIEDAGRFRVNIVRLQADTALAVRCLPERAPEIPAELRALSALEDGLVLLSGHGRSGRTSTLAALVDEINRRRSCHILTLEDPIEFVHQEVASHITQRDLGVEGVRTADALRQALHLDADAIAVGRVACSDEAVRLVEAAEAGGLVLAVVDAGSPEQAIERLVQLFPFDQRASLCDRLASVLRAATWQRLVPSDGGVIELEATVRRLASADVQALRENRVLEPSRNGSPRT